MRLSIAALVIVGLPAVATAQPLGTPMSLPPIALPLPPLASPLPPLASPLPPLASPLPPLGLPPVTHDARQIAEPRPLPRLGNRSHRPGRKPGVHGPRGFVYVVPAYPAYGFDGLPWTPAGTAVPGFFPGWSGIDDREEAPAYGTLRIEVEPAGILQLYVDGSYIGTPADFRDGVPLGPGIHTIEIRAPGYETLQFDANIPANRSITYRGALKPASVPALPKPRSRADDLAPRKPMTFYLIPGCYAGNVPPKDAGLPAACDESRVITFAP